MDQGGEQSDLCQNRLAFSSYLQVFISTFMVVNATHRLIAQYSMKIQINIVCYRSLERSN